MYNYIASAFEHIAERTADNKINCQYNAHATPLYIVEVS